MMNKIINSRCSCGVTLIYKTFPLIMLLPCEHILHEKCHKATSCEICNEPVDKIKTFADIKRESNNGIINYQRYIDMVAVSNFDHMSDVQDFDIQHLFDAIGAVGMIPFNSGYDDHTFFCHEFLRILNTKMIIKGSEYIDSKPKVYIVNHSSFIDFAVVNSLFECGYVSGSHIKKSAVGRLIMKMVPLMLIDRGKAGGSTVEKMKKHIKKHGSLCLFPEGMVTHPDVIQRFRTGAFHTGYPVQPVIIRYDKLLYDDDLTKFIKKLTTNNDVTVTVTILPIQSPPFDDQKIEAIRNKMACAGNMAVSRVSNRDIKEL